MRFPVVRDAIPYLMLGFGLLVVAALGGWSILAWPIGLLTAFVAFFFRDPERVAPGDPDAILAPADGKVVQIRSEDDGRIRLSIFLSVFNVHVNRSPVTGKVSSTEYRPGRFLAAFREAASAENEQNTLWILPEGGKEAEVGVRQIAGAIARRIVCWTGRGQVLQAGERFGLIKFGSRVDLFLPPGVRLSVVVGDKVRGGADVVARWVKVNGT